MRRRIADGLALVGLLVALTAAPAAPGQAATYLAGIDVSHWQGTIDWSQVAHDPQSITFAIIKATEAQTYVDPQYATNRSGAKANGIKTGAYHFARPDTTTNDGKLEADWFVKNAAPAAGDLVPALDLEVNGGLAPQALIDWTQQWLTEVVSLTGVKPMIYSNPSFWTNSLANTTKFADEGFTTLWIAHWNVPSPTVPANNWGGHGWTFWQWTDADHVSGISTNIDGDRYNGTDMTPVLIPAMVQRLAPSRLPQGAAGTPVGVSGTNFRPGITVSVSGAGVTVNSVTVNSATSMTVNVSVDPAAALGPRDVTATNTDTTSGTCFGCLTVAPPNNAVTTGGFGSSRTNLWDLVNRNQGSIPSGQHALFTYGSPGDHPIVGDWDGNGTFTPGVVRGNIWYLKNSFSGGAADIVFAFGTATDIKVVGDWDGNGTWTPGVVRGNTWYLKNSLSGGAADIVFTFGLKGDVPIVGDWNGDGRFTPGVVRGTTWYLRTSATSGVATVSFTFGIPGDVPAPGDWDGDGSWTPGVYRPSTRAWFLRNSLSSGVGDVGFIAPASGMPLAGNWDGLDPP